VPSSNTPVDPISIAVGTMKSACPTPTVRSTRAVSTSCRSSDINPAIMLNVPKNIASSSVPGTASFAIALNCHPAIVVVTAEIRISAAMDFK
jgi:hypothetical protein